MQRELCCVRAPAASPSLSSCSLCWPFPGGREGSVPALTLPSPHPVPPGAAGTAWPCSPSSLLRTQHKRLQLPCGHVPPGLGWLRGRWKPGRRCPAPPNLLLATLGPQQMKTFSLYLERLGAESFLAEAVGGVEDQRGPGLTSSCSPLDHPQEVYCSFVFRLGFDFGVFLCSFSFPLSVPQ